LKNREGGQMKKILGILVSLLLIVTMFSVSASIKINNDNNLPFCKKLTYNNQQKISIWSSTDIVWDKTYGGRSSDYGNFAIQTTDGGYIFCGKTYSYIVNGKWCDGWMVKTDLYGNELWNKSYGGKDSDSFHCVQQTSDGGYILTGSQLYSGEFSLWLMKTNDSGTKEWEKTYGDSDWDMGHFVQQTMDGGFIIVGRTEQYTKPEDIWLVKTDSQGNLMWDKTFDTGTHEYGFCVQQTNDGGYILVGDIFTPEPYGHLGGWAIKTDSDGNIEWDKIFSYAVDDCKTKSIYQTSDNGYIISGGTACFGNTGVDAWLIKIDENGNEEWNRSYGGVEHVDEAKCVQQTSDGGYIFTGNADGDLRLVKTNATGIMEWDKRYGGSNVDYGRSVQQVSDGGYIIGGCTNSYGAGAYDLWLIKTDENGNLNESNHRPNKPMTPSGPTNGEVGILYTYTSNTIDSDGDIIYYWFDWGDGSSSGWIGPYPSGETVEASHKWTIPDDFWIKVKAKDEHGREGEWSDPYIIKIGHQPPSIPIIDGPTHGKVGVEYTYTFNSTDYKGDYCVCIVNWGDGSPSETVPPAGGPNGSSPGIASHSWDAKGTYTIKARGMDHYGNYGDWGTLTVTMPRNKADANPMLLRIIERFPLFQKLIQQLRVGL
jgi:hypothetical protein